MRERGGGVRKGGSLVPLHGLLRNCKRTWPNALLNWETGVLVRSISPRGRGRGERERKTKALLLKLDPPCHELPTRRGKGATLRPQQGHPPGGRHSHLGTRGEQVVRTRFNGPWPEHKGKKRKKGKSVLCNDASSRAVTPCTPTSPARSPRARAPAGPAAGSRSTCTCLAPSA